jgi:hypothetical protein
MAFIAIDLSQQNRAQCPSKNVLAAYAENWQAGFSGSRESIVFNAAGSRDKAAHECPVNLL